MQARKNSSRLISLVLRGALVAPSKPPLNCDSVGDSTRLKAFSWVLLPSLLLMPALVQAQPAPRSSTDIQRERVEQLKELVQTKRDLQDLLQTTQRKLAQFDARIAALEASLGVTPSQEEPPQGNWGATISNAVLSSPPETVYAKSSDAPSYASYTPRAPSGTGYEGSPTEKEVKEGPLRIRKRICSCERN